MEEFNDSCTFLPYHSKSVIYHLSRNLPLHTLIYVSVLSCTCAQSSKKASAGHGKKNPPLELTEDQKQEIREAFDLFDTDGSGKTRALLYYVFVLC